MFSGSSQIKGVLWGLCGGNYQLILVTLKLFRLKVMFSCRIYLVLDCKWRWKKVRKITVLLSFPIEFYRMGLLFLHKVYKRLISKQSQQDFQLKLLLITYCQIQFKYKDIFLMSLGQQIFEQTYIKPFTGNIYTIQFPAKIESSSQLQQTINCSLDMKNDGRKSIQNQDYKYSLLLRKNHDEIDCKDQPKILDFIFQFLMSKSVLQFNPQLIFERLTILNLNVNNIVSIQKLGFLPLNQLGEIHLSMNKINNLKVLSKVNLKHLTYLNVCENRLKTIHKMSRSDFASLQMFWTYDNLISSHQQIFKLNSTALNGFQIANLENVPFFMSQLYKKFKKIAQSVEHEQFQNYQLQYYQQTDFK